MAKVTYLRIDRRSCQRYCALETKILFAASLFVVEYFGLVKTQLLWAVTRWFVFSSFFEIRLVRASSRRILNKMFETYAMLVSWIPLRLLEIASQSDSFRFYAHTILFIDTTKRVEVCSINTAFLSKHGTYCKFLSTKFCSYRPLCLPKKFILIDTGPLYWNHLLLFPSRRMKLWFLQDPFCLSASYLKHISYQHICWEETFGCIAPTWLSISY